MPPLFFALSPFWNFKSERIQFAHTASWGMPPPGHGSQQTDTFLLPSLHSSGKRAAKHFWMLDKMILDRACLFSKESKLRF